MTAYLQKFVMPRFECLEIINQLKLNAISKYFDEIVTEGIKRKRSTLGILHRLLKIELTEGQIEYRINQAKFPQPKSLTDFNF